MMRSKIYKILLALVCLVGIERFCYFQTRGFRFPKATTTHSYPFSASFETPPDSLFQDFTFFDKGVQFYVFMGKDEKTVLKLFKHHHTGPSYALVNTFPKKIRAPLIQKREQRMCHLLKSVKIAQDHMKEATGILYTHLGKTENTLGAITLYDAIGVKHTLNLDQTEFVLQKRIEPTDKRLKTLFSQGKTEEAISCMQGLLSMVETRSMANIRNKDKRMIQNTGFFEDKPIEVDLGSFAWRKKVKPFNPHEKAKRKMALHLVQWVRTHYPQYTEEVEAKLL